jgi:hypothetical protein
MSCLYIACSQRESLLSICNLMYVYSFTLCLHVRAWSLFMPNDFLGILRIEGNLNETLTRDIISYGGMEEERTRRHTRAIQWAT